MTGALQIKPSTATTALDIFPGPSQSSGTSVFRVFGDNNQSNLYISTGGNLGARQGWSPSLSNHLTTKNYVDLLDSQTRDYVDSKFNSQMPIGSIIFWGGTAAKIPNGWVECKGQAAPSSVKELTGLTNIPNLYNYMPAGAGGVFGPSVGRYHSSKTEKHSHSVSRLEPGNTTGWPKDSKDSSTTATRYWRGNKSSNGSEGSYNSVESSETGDDITAPPVYTGIYIMKVA